MIHSDSWPSSPPVSERPEHRAQQDPESQREHTPTPGLHAINGRPAMQAFEYRMPTLIRMQMRRQGWSPGTHREPEATNRRLLVGDLDSAR